MAKPIDVARAEKIAALIDRAGFEGEAMAALARMKDMLEASGTTLGEAIIAGIKSKAPSPRAPSHEMVWDERTRRSWADAQARQAGFR